VVWKRWWVKAPQLAWIGFGSGFFNVVGAG
jgi:hypothetical protein